MGLGLVALGVGCLEFTLDKGQEKDWFGDPMIRTFAILAAATLIFFAWWEWHHPDPIVDLKLLKNRNFGTAVFLQLILGMVLFGSTVLIPQYLQVLLGYTAERAGMVLSPAGFVMMIMMVVAGRSLGKIDPRLMVCLGYLATAAGIYNLTRLDLNTAFGTVTLWRMLQVIGLPFIFIPISTLNYVGVPAQQDEPDLQPLQLRPQPRRQRRHRAAHHLPRPQRAGPSGQPRRPRHSRQRSLPPLHGPHERDDDVPRNVRRQRNSRWPSDRPTSRCSVRPPCSATKTPSSSCPSPSSACRPLPFIMRLPSKAAKPDPEALAGH